METGEKLEHDFDAHQRASPNLGAIETETEPHAPPPTPDDDEDDEYNLAKVIAGCASPRMTLRSMVIQHIARNAICTGLIWSAVLKATTTQRGAEHECMAL